MKYKFTITSCFVIISCCLYAQQFTSITTGSIVTANRSSGGCSWSDYNNDGYPDLYVSNTNGNNQLFKNNGDGTFQEITTGAIVNSGGVSNSAIWGDYDNDGNLDLFVSNNPAANASPQLNFLYKNNGAPSYDFSTILTPATQTNANYTWSSSWVDYDNDGDIDLHMPENKHLRRDFFYENNGDGTFTTVNPAFVTPDVESTGVVSWMDYDHDGDQDLFMIKSGRSHPTKNGEDNRIYHNLLKETGNLEFKRVTTAGMVKHFDLDFQASWADYDNDGDMDVYLGNFDNRNYLYRNDGDSLFTKVTSGPAVLDNTRTLGSTWGDFDNDGDLDLFVGNTSGQTSRYYQNDGAGNFTSLNAIQVGTLVSSISNIQACASADYNNDGYLDLYIANSFLSGNPSARNFLYLNNGGSNNYLEINCKGTVSNAAAIGTKIWAKATINGTSVWQLRHLTGNPTGNRSQDDLRVHFGLGDAESVDSLIIEWPLGLREVYTAVASNQQLQLIEGQTTSTAEIDIAEDLIKVYPNPFSDETTITYQVNQNHQNIQLSVLDASQRVIAVLFKGKQQIGIHKLKMNTGRWNSGTYYLLLENGASIRSKTLIVVK